MYQAPRTMFLYLGPVMKLLSGFLAMGGRGGAQSCRVVGANPFELDCPQELRFLDTYLFHNRKESKRGHLKAKRLGTKL